VAARIAEQHSSHKHTSSSSSSSSSSSLPSAAELLVTVGGRAQTNEARTLRRAGVEDGARIVLLRKVGREKVNCEIGTTLFFFQ
jgi:hypothetical protein